MSRTRMGVGLKAVLVAAAVGLACLPGHASATPVTGISEQQRTMFTSPAFRALGIERVRIVAPWDAALTGDARTREWIETALDRGHSVLVAFDKARGVQCPDVNCVAPEVAEYEAAVAAFRARWPQITDITPWNEPNHRDQPTFSDPALAAGYYNAVRRVCPDCRITAGDFLDDSYLLSWLASYRRALAEQPEIWALHNYYDATYYSSRGVDTLLDRLPGQVWLTETGGIVRFSPEGGGGLPYDEARAADAIRWLYAMTASRPRVTRMYLYHWQAAPSFDFDAGLVGPAGEERPSLDVVREELARKPDAPDAPATGGSSVDSGASSTGPIRSSSKATRVRLSGKALRLQRRGLRVRVSCVSAPSRCSGRIVVRPGRRSAGAASLRLTVRFRLRPGRSLTRDVALTRRQRTAIRSQRRLRVSICLDGSKTCRSESRPVQAG